MNLTVLGQSISFFIFVYLCFKYIWPPVISVLEARKNQIEEGLRMAYDAKNNLKIAENEAEQLLVKAKKESIAIAEKAKLQSESILLQARDRSETEYQAMLEKAKADIMREQIEIADKIEKLIVETSVQMASKILEQELVSQDKSLQTAENLIKSLDFEKALKDKIQS